MITRCVWVENQYIKNVSCDVFQNPLARMSTQGPSFVFVENASKFSPLSGWRIGSVVALWQTLVSRVAVMSCSSLWHIIGNPPM